MQKILGVRQFCLKTNYLMENVQRNQCPQVPIQKFTSTFSNKKNKNSVTILTEILPFSSESEDEKSIPDQLVKKATRPTSKMIKHSKTTATPPESKVKIKGKDTGNAILKLCRIKFTSHPSVVCVCVCFFFYIKAML